MPVPNLLSKYGIQSEVKKKSGVPDLIGTKYNNFKATVETPVVPTKPGILSRIGSAFNTGLQKTSDFIAGAAEAPTYTTGSTKEILKNLPGEIVRTLLPGAAALSDNPEEAAQLTNKDIAKELPGAVFQTAVAPALSYPLTAYGAASKYINPKLGLGAAPGVDETGAVSIKTPLGPITNVQARIAAEPTPTTNMDVGISAVKNTAFELLNSLFTASLAGKIVNPRLTALTPKIKATEGPAVQQGPKTGQLYEPTGKTQPVTPAEFTKATTENGIPISTKYNPNQPIIFIAKGNTGKFYQIKPSFLSEFMSKFKGDPTKVPQTQLIPITKDIAAPKTEVPVVPEKPVVTTIEKPTAPTAPIVDPKLQVIIDKIKAKQSGITDVTPPEAVPPTQVAPKPSLTIKAAEKTGPSVEMKGETKFTPEQLVSKSEVKNLLKSLGKDSVDFAVIEEKNVPLPMTYGGIKHKNVKYLTYKQGNTEIKLRPSALGLVEDNIKAGQTININAKDLKPKGTAMRGVTEGGDIEASTAGDLSNVVPARTPEEMIKRIEQLNKFGQAYNILRKTGGVSKKNLGHFKGKGGSIGPKGTRGIVELRDSTALSPSQYMSTLAHELGHALEHTVVGKTNKDTYSVFGRDLTNEQKATLRDELKAVTQDLVGKATADGKPGYYYKNTELFARFLEKMFVSPANLTELAPTAMDLFSKSAIENPIIGEYIDAVNGAIDKGERKSILLRDMKQTYIKELGTRVGTMAWNDEVRYRAMKERAKVLIEKLVTDKFKGVEDSPELLFQAAESIKVTKDGVPEFGTRDFKYAETEKEIAAMEEAGYRAIKDSTGDQLYEVIGGKQYARYAKPRYTEEQGKALYEQLSPEGKKLINDFTASKDDAKDYFNREVIKDVNKINSNIEGWVHHFWEDKPISGGGGKRLQVRITSARKERTGAEGYVEDLKKAMTKVLTELETDKAYNSFIQDWFSRITKPIAKGKKADLGWEEVVGDVNRGGIGTRQEVRTMVIKDGEAFPANQARYQMPKVIYERYKKIKEVADEASKAMRLMNNLNRYWRVNILFHPGSAATNFISGGIQYSSKVLTDFYTEALTGNVSFPQTRKDIYSMFSVLTPKGWQNAPDWVVGGDLSNFYGQFTKEQTPGLKIIESSVDTYADKALKLYGAVERYWKKVISTSEGVESLEGLNTITKEGLRLPTEMEKEVLDFVNNEVDLFAYDYDNVPVWLQNYQQNPAWQSVKPFAKYPYKYIKQIDGMIGAAFDGTKTWQERMSSILALGTMVAVYAYIRNKQKSKSKTVPVPESAPYSVSTQGRMYVATDAEGKELFTRTSKYPFINLTEAGLQFSEGNAAQGFQIITDMIGSLAPAGVVAAAILGYKSKYQQYTPTPIIAGQALASFVPGTRILSDISKFFDPYQRTPKTFSQAFTSFYPTTNAELQDKLHGKIKTIQVPLEGSVTPAGDVAGEGTRRTTTDMYVRNYKTDVLLGLLGGIYVNRIDPNVAEAFSIRAEKSAETKAKADAKKRLSDFYK